MFVRGGGGGVVDSQTSRSLDSYTRQRYIDYRSLVQRIQTVQSSRLQTKISLENLMFARRGGGGGFVDSQTSRSLDSSNPYGKYLTNSQQIHE